MSKPTATVANSALTVELHHRAGCPEGEGRRFGDPSNPANPRQAIGIEAYVVTGTGRYNRVTGEFDAVPRTGVVRCIECAEELLVDPAIVPSIQQMLAAPAATEVQING